MTIATEVKKLTESKPFYAVAGAGDYAVEKLRELPAALERLTAQRGELREQARELPVKAREYAAKAEGYARELPEKAKEYADALNTRATAIYEDFATRGRRVVSRVSGDAALELEQYSEESEADKPAPAPARKPATRKAPAKA
ncbi:putative MPP superfamily phosphohydrolase [Thermocatellispora tengchongensis]|uniref:Putative MPP superfamily phosphohydrolase n=1 Tax=Thermocatellispora tengchongensis TaxID=1073253 RepID=A0A840PII4_9ACTN|nr:hypothetical protein [Thermocatellispora tengchongensis]MBB5138789.1 putative MPP superfamily phosphohydrolase [Thermocatellispora tengchongensis]